MGEVVNFQDLVQAREVLDTADREKRIEAMYALQGEAYCLACHESWWTTAFPGDIDLQCPKCKTHRGVFKYPVEPSPEEQMFQCNCGCNLFTFASKLREPLLAVCLACGQHHNPLTVSGMGMRDLS